MFADLSNVDPKTIATVRAECGVRYWEDSCVNGERDTEGDLIPLRTGDCWTIDIDTATGRIRNWPEGTTAQIHYKICDAGVYTLLDTDGKTLASWDGYVPKFLSPLESHFGDYAIMTINEKGDIEGWVSGWADFLVRM